MSIGNYLPTTNTKLFYKFEGNLNDSSGNNFTGTGNTITYGNANGMFNQGISLNGSSSWVSSIPSGTLKDNFTISIWVKPAIITGGLQVINSRTPSNGSFDMQLVTSNTIHMDIGNGSSWITTTANASVVLSTTLWSNIIVTISTTFWKVYVNGQLKGSSTFATASPLLWDATHNILIGSYQKASGFYSGLMDELIIENIVWSDNVIGKYYTMCKGRFNII